LYVRTYKSDSSSRPLPHPIIGSEVRICIFTKDPQRAYKDLVASDSFPAALQSKVGRVLGLDKLKKKYKSYEAKRQLLAEYDIFMVDDRIIKIVADFLGKTFYGSKAKRPIPLKLTAGAYIDKSKKGENVVGTAQGVAKEIETALHATYVSMSPSTNTSVKVGKLSMTPAQLKENIEAVVEKLVEKHIEHKWRNVRRLEIKGPTTKSLPIWLADEMWTSEAQVLEQAPTFAVGNGDKKGEKKRKWEEWEQEMLDDEDLAEIKEKRAKKNSSKAAKKDPQAKQLGAISKEKRSKLKKEALQSVPAALVSSS
jgi:ribosome biogenesis protein UTP30